MHQQEIRLVRLIGLRDTDNDLSIRLAKRLTCECSNIFLRLAYIELEK
jgi:hypothetical protein